MITFTGHNYQCFIMVFSKSSSIILLVFSLLAFSACEETIILDYDFESRLVISSFFNSDSAWTVEVSNSVNGLDPKSEIELVENARVTIYDEDNIQLYELIHVGDGVYANDERPVAGRGYNIKVQVGAKVLTAYSYVPAETELKINNLSVVKKDNNEGIEVDFQIEDKSNLEAYFIWDIVSLETNEENEPITSGEKLSDALISNLNGSTSVIDSEKIEIINLGILDDGTFTTVYNTLNGRNGRSGSTDKNITTYNYGHNFVSETLVGVGSDDSISAFDPNGGGNSNPINFGGTTTPTGPKFELRVVSISKELFDFYNSSLSSQGVLISSVFSPLPLYTNIENGLGVFAGFNETIIRF